jgi:hypothetical protein
MQQSLADLASGRLHTEALFFFASNHPNLRKFELGTSFSSVQVSTRSIFRMIPS